MSKKIGFYIVLIALIIAALYDLYQVIAGGTTISQVMTTGFEEHGTIIFAVGFICGHWLGSVTYNN